MSKPYAIEKYLQALINQINEANSINEPTLVAYRDFLDKNDADLVIEYIKKTGFFRPSKYSFDINLISPFFHETLNHINFKKFSEYFSNIENLFKISNRVKQHFKNIKSLILTERNLIKYFFAKSDNIFYDYENNKEPEFTLECISFLILESKKNQYTNGINLNLPNHINNKDYTALLKLSETIVNFKKIEIKIDFFSYKLEKINKKNYKLTNSSFEKNISMSYIIYNQQRHAIHYHTLEFKKNNKTFKEITTELLNKENINLFAEVKNTPFLRICPKLIIHPVFLDFLSTDFIYLEEESQLNFFLIDNFLSKNDINTKIYKNFTIMDVIKLQRLFKFISIVYRVYFNKKKLKDKNILLSSIIPITTKEYLNTILKKTLNTKDKNFLDLVQNTISTDFYKIDDFLDIQYNPILSLGNEFLISPTILANSNLIRSILLRTKKNPAITPNGDKMIKILEEKFKKLGFSIATEVKLGAYEIDIIAKKGSEVFIFECKNSYHPVNEFELRNSFSHIKKASSQLNNLENMINNTSTRKNLAKKIGFSLYKSNFNFAIILSNRIFNGYIYENYRCINSYILKNLLNEGTVNINSNKYSLWKDINFHENDLVEFINGKFISNYELLAHESFTSLNIKDITISSQRFGFILEEIAEYIDKNYRKI